MSAFAVKVLNRYKPEAGRKVRKVYCGRPSIWGNPFPVGEGRFTRNDSIWNYFWYLVANPTLVAKVHELNGCDLECYCKPKACHCDVLIQLANNAVLQFQFIHHLCMPKVTAEQYAQHKESLTGEQIRIIEEIMGKVFPTAMQRMLNEKAEAEAAKPASIADDILEVMRAEGDFGTPDPEFA